MLLSYELQLSSFFLYKIEHIVTWQYLVTANFRSIALYLYIYAWYSPIFRYHKFISVEKNVYIQCTKKCTLCECTQFSVYKLILFPFESNFNLYISVFLKKLILPQFSIQCYTQIFDSTEGIWSYKVLSSDKVAQA